MGPAAFSVYLLQLFDHIQQDLQQPDEGAVNYPVCKFSQFFSCSIAHSTDTMILLGTF